MYSLIAYKTNLGLIFSAKNFSYTDFSKFLINGKHPEKLRTVAGTSWYKIDDDVITSFQVLAPEKNTQIGWKLKKDTPNISIPAELSMEELSKVYDDDEEEYVFTGKWKALANLYEPIYHTSQAGYTEEEFEVTIIREIEIENISEPVQMKVKSLEGSFNGKVMELDLTSITNYEEIEQILTPEFLMHERPCHLTSHAMYKIVRQFVRQHINPLVATITSDYEFCFNVAKKVAVKPYEIKREKYKSLFKSYNPPRFETSIATTKQVEIFKMSHDKAGDRGAGPYKGYSSIAPLYASNLQELAGKLKAYLDDLMYNINMPVKECECCNGTGHIVQYQELKEFN